MLEHIDRVFTAREVSEQIGVKPVTLRAWSRQLESSGYKIIRDAERGRLYTERDIAALRKFKDLMERGLRWIEACAIIIQEYGHGSDSAITIADNAPAAQSQALIDALMERIECQEKAMQALLERLEERDKRLEEAIKRRDEQLLAAIRQLQEQTRQQIAAASAQENSRRPWWKRLFGQS